ncbi:class I SAM-dependent methyltransferase [Bdellovibrio sp. SKB1291214]|uniref:class I SAM-dependent methyltransferase n=1 Tax=Bdellovibrio sp. SKB1291214 TaxID=1732569 RepID=UPI000B517364|nr:class I SAM-dependent methyltransferase [Bdellovibrio sp. SKB1291214]UYL09388.1 class I SAM-dependent methyltransferase [Bdellovibrio sp. SKB1291214]
MKCVLCENPDSARFKVIKKPERSYYHCNSCDLIFMAPEDRMSAIDEKARYDQHQNEDQAGYRAFLAPLMKDVEEYTAKSGKSSNDMHLLDYGCGPTAFLGACFVSKDYQVTNYDLYYQPDQDALKKSYNIVTSTEVWEHFHNPKIDIETQLRTLKPGGLLAVMTSAHKGEAHFHDWHYRRDVSHVSFFSDKTMQWFAQKYNMKTVKAKSPYWVFKKQ